MILTNKEDLLNPEITTVDIILNYRLEHHKLEINCQIDNKTVYLLINTKEEFDSISQFLNENKRNFDTIVLDRYDYSQYVFVGYRVIFT